MLPARRSPHDREIVRLALPAFGALAAEPLYILVDTAIVGHLGTNPLAGLAVAGTVLTATFAIFNFLAYSTTGAVARQIGAGNRRAAAENGVEGLWLATGLGVGIAGSAWGTVLAQYGAALAYVAIVARSVRREHASVRPQAAGIRASASVGGRLVVRTGSLLAAFL